MSFQVGIFPMDGKVAVYNENNKETINFKITTKIREESKKEDIEKMFKEIKTKIIGKPGYVCIYLLYYYNNQIRINFIEKGKEFGFMNVQIINENMSLYLEYITQINQKPKNGDIIWMYKYGSLHIWKKVNSKAKMVKMLGCGTKERFIEIMQKEKNDNGNEITSDIFIYNKFDSADLNFIKSMFPKCQCFEVLSNMNFSVPALIKARIMAKDEEVLDFDVDAQLDEDIDVKINENVVMSIKKYESLPFEKTLSLHDDNEKVLKIFSFGVLRDEIKVSQIKEIYKSDRILVKIDENGIITIDTAMPSVNCLTKQLAIKYEKKETTNLQSWITANQSKNSEHVLTSFEKRSMISIDDNNSNIVGIDLGTTRCFAAVNRRNKIETIALDNTGERPLPSYVSFNDEKDLCGQIVINQFQNNEKSTVYDSKRIIGMDFTEVEINQTWSFKVVNDKNKPIILINDGKIKKAPEEIAAVLLKHIKLKAEEIQGKELGEVVITIPADFSQNQKIATHVAALLAGWETVHFLAEPIAASIAYFVERPIPLNFNLLLFDLGGGTLDISIFKIVKDKLKIEAINGDANLGGRDFDKLLFDYFKSFLKKENNIEIEENGSLKYRLMEKSMEIKHTLSTETETSLDVSDFNSKTDSYLNITRVEFERKAFPLLNRIQETLIQTLSNTDYTALDINKILLVGGGSKMPMIKSLVQDMFTNAEHSYDRHPDEIIATGAAYYASYLSSQNNSYCSLM